MTALTCSKCGRELPVAAFTPRPDRPRGYKSWCRDCDNAKSRRYYAANADRVIARVSAKAKGKRAGVA